MFDRFKRMDDAIKAIQENCGIFLEEGFGEKRFLNNLMAAVEVEEQKKQKLIEENRLLQNENELLRQTIANERKAWETQKIAERHEISMEKAQSIRLLDECKKFVEDVDLKHKMKELVKMAG